eukprot:6288846-Amphidinium_carterae.1
MVQHLHTDIRCANGSQPLLVVVVAALSIENIGWAGIATATCHCWRPMKSLECHFLQCTSETNQTRTADPDSS